MGLTEGNSTFRNMQSKNKTVSENPENSGDLSDQDRENDIPVVCCGTSEGAIIWCSTGDPCGIILASLVWMMMLFSMAVCIMIMMLEQNGDYNKWNGCIILFLITMGMWSHAATMCGDPGAVPSNARPLPEDIEDGEPASICGRCDAYKPPMSHHDKNSNRCISRMDHFCPWTNK